MAAAGEIGSVIGPDGSGESSFPECLIGAVRARSGTVEFDGVDCARLQVHERVHEHSAAFVPQFDKVLRPLSFRDNLRAEGQLMPRRERDKRLAELFDLTPRVRASTGSSSQLAIGLGATAVGRLPRHDAAATDADAGRTLIRTSPVRASELFDTIAGIRQRDGAAVMLVEQNATQSLSISERVVVQGRVAMTDQAGGPTGIEGWA